MFKKLSANQIVVMFLATVAMIVFGALFVVLPNDKIALAMKGICSLGMIGVLLSLSIRD
ncbi:hypothetical protein ABIC83_002769 [Roseateles asaccharophilus]|uniref:hypothetical protein n=1 Tax=Roseateles asaccharophilus TaxID=582607 RepID=UPI00383778AF